jgi:hypothetical protein
MNLLPALALAPLISDDACSARLDQLLAVYREYGLPVSPPDAALVRKATSGIYSKVYLEICSWSEEDAAQFNRDDCSGVVVKPDPAALGSDLIPGELGFALQCHERGWHALARAAFRKWLTPDPSLFLTFERRRDSDECGENPRSQPNARAERQLACTAWRYWYDQLSAGAPLTVVATYLARALPHTGFVNEPKLALVRSLERALVPSRATPGSDDALIDAMIEARAEAGTLHPERSPAYRALARRGFDAIPALIAHLGDDRLTRTIDWRLLRVKDVVYRLLCEFAGEQLETSNDIARRTFAAGRWFAEAQKMGEEEYVVAHVGQRGFPPEDDVLFPLLVERYPKRVPDAYRNFIEKQPERGHLGEPFARAIAELVIPRPDKLKVFEFAAAHSSPYTRLDGLRYLCQLDRKRGNELLVAALDRIEEEPTDPEIELAELVAGGSDPSAWAALARLALRVGPRNRVRLFWAVGNVDKPEPAARARQLAFVASHLTDTAVLDTPNGILGLYYRPTKNGCVASFIFTELKRCEVRNCAVARLAWVIGGEDKLQPNWTAVRWEQLRERVRQGLEHEMRR